MTLMFFRITGLFIFDLLISYSFFRVLERNIAEHSVVISLSDP